MASNVAIGFVCVAGAAAIAVGVGSKMLQAEADERARTSVSDLVNLIEVSSKGDVRVTYGLISSSLFDNEVIVNDVAFKMVDGTTVFSVDSVGLSADGGVASERLPHSADLLLQGVEVVHEDALKEIQRRWDADVSGRSFDAAIGYKYNGAGDVITPTFSFSGKGFAGVDAVITVSNVRGIWSILESNYATKGVSIDFERDELRTLDKLVRSLRLNRAAFTYVNGGELDAWLEGEAEANDLSVEELKLKFPDVVDYHLEDRPFAPDVLSFLLEPKNISVDIDPGQPLALEDVAARLDQLVRWDVKDAIEGLSMTVKTNQTL